MNQVSHAVGADRAALQRFMQRVSATLGHDLRTPLGTIVNYASVLEEDPELAVAGLREVPRRIRGQAMQLAEMLQLLLDATNLAAAPPGRTAVDPDLLLRTVIAELEGDPLVRERPAVPMGAAADAATAPPPDALALEPRIVAFAWRSFLGLARRLSSRALAAARVAVDARSERVRLSLIVGRDGEADVPPLAFDEFVRSGGGDVSAAHRLALRLSRDLVAARGGELSFGGRLGADAAIHLEFPPAA
jgi:K+-sensing histidine kinase KdpD